MTPAVRRPQHQHPHPVGMAQGQLLGHHSPKGEPEDMDLFQTQAFKQGGGVIRQSGHGILAFLVPASARSPVVIEDKGEIPPQLVQETRVPPTQVRTVPPDHQQGFPLPSHAVMEPRSRHLHQGHGIFPLLLPAAAPAFLLHPAYQRSGTGSLIHSSRNLIPGERRYRRWFEREFVLLDETAVRQT